MRDLKGETREVTNNEPRMRDLSVEEMRLVAGGVPPREGYDIKTFIEGLEHLFDYEGGKGDRL